MKVSTRVLRLRRQLYELARSELERRQAEEDDPAVVSNSRRAASNRSTTIWLRGWVSNSPFGKTGRRARLTENTHEICSTALMFRFGTSPKAGGLERRHLTPGQRAMLLAIAYPEPKRGIHSEFRHGTRHAFSVAWRNWGFLHVTKPRS